VQSGEPLQYLTGEREFYNLTFPGRARSPDSTAETEILSRKAIGLVRTSPVQGARFLDVGTGSGCIAISVPTKSNRSEAGRWTVSADALDIARGMSSGMGSAERIFLVRSTAWEWFPAKPVFDFIFCQSPYVALGIMIVSPPKSGLRAASGFVRRRRPEIEFYRDFISEVPPRLMPGGYLLSRLARDRLSRSGTWSSHQDLSVDEY